MERQKPINPWWTLDEPVNSASAPAKGSKRDSSPGSFESDASPKRREMDDAAENNHSDTGEEE